MNTVYSFEFAQSSLAQYTSEADSPSLEFTHSPILLHNPDQILQLGKVLNSISDQWA